MLSGENSHLYNMHEFHKISAAPLSMAAKLGYELHTHSLSPLSYLPYSRRLAAGCKLVERFTRRYQKPEFGIEHTVIDGKRYKVTEHIVEERAFASLIKFERARDRKDPKLLIVAPMSGHFATLLRGTVEALIPHFEVYITDWEDAREVPLFAGEFHYDDYVDYVTDFLRVLGPKVHVLAVCQPAVPVLSAVSLMNAAGDPKCPRSMTLIGGPIDTRINPTEVNKMAEQRSIEWFRTNVITRVPMNYPGFMRRVYPGFIQLSGFMQMNLERHIGEHVNLFNHLVEGDGDSADTHKKFYNEYLAVMDLPAEFYLETVKAVFQDHSLPRGKMKVRGETVDPSAITRTALLTLEGELDDISGVGQTQAAQTLCSKLPARMKHHYVQKGVGHYGIFNGRKFREFVVPVIAQFAKDHDVASRPKSTSTSSTTTKKAPAKSPVAKKAALKKTAKKSATKKPAAKKPATKKAAAKKTAAKKPAAKKSATKSTSKKGSNVVKISASGKKRKPVSKPRSTA